MGVGKTKIRHSAHPNEHQGRSKGWPFYLKAKLNQRRKTNDLFGGRPHRNLNGIFDMRHFFHFGLIMIMLTIGYGSILRRLEEEGEYISLVLLLSPVVWLLVR
jgi:hypothetical protein